MLLEFVEIVALEGAFWDRVPNRRGLFFGYLVVGGPQLKNQVVRVGYVSARRRPALHSERL
jgi:hypothetical protein